MTPYERDREDPDKWKALGLAALVHILLILFLVVGVSWQHQDDASMAVEMWSDIPGTPGSAASAPPPPPPPPKVAEAQPEPTPKAETKATPTPVDKPDIALKQDKKKPEPKKEEVKKPEPKPEVKKEEPKKPEPKKETPKKPDTKPTPETPPSKNDKPVPPSRKYDPMAELNKDIKDLNHSRGLASARAQAAKELGGKGSGSAGNSAGNGNGGGGGHKGDPGYAAKIRAKVRGNVIEPPGLTGNPSAVFVVTQLPSGEVINVRKVKSSGIPAYDDALERAINKSSPLPQPEDKSSFQRELHLTFCPQDSGCNK